MDGSGLGRLLIAVGVIIVGVGIFLALGGKLPFGRLPGDVSTTRGNVSFSFPIVSCIVLSIVLTIVINIIMRK